ncbi:MAG: N-formylglutamate amidohydrolase [Methanothrix sp.]|jgi:N-formylglutamate amidohydrolase|uniref:N-formylglutamate amidohydrolase n=1 Tax=Methanothrix harundinacea TaxID=301375 RepID=A0A117MBJ3_9EURY|nr:MAG: N-formylglutamate amidohydrolase [Methanothrix harundinacea]MDD2637777.1 N-formylglutamate amidohydrolase [Methanothrix sp.]MDI9398321.1 N-formylglutamate amidohydrolase [Euryarchaeota archaeon]KUK94899.1 MAG: N-formylglutamate amidohydrolase [Methanothrix harundinacea]MDD3710597.1 N-formylglutamate amidohydrolase [Methanothrix sp.]
MHHTNPISAITKGEIKVPVIAHVPHGSTFIPEDVRRSIVLSDSDLEKELLLITDRYTPELFDAAVDLGGIALVNNYSRLVIDPERFEDNEKEVMASKGMGVIYTRTAYQQVLRRDLSGKEREELLSTYYRPYHRAVELEVEGILDRFDRCLIIDCHSFPSKPLPYEIDQDPNRPDICIGTDSFHTPKVLIEATLSFCEANGIKVAIDKPFAGTYVPLECFGKDGRVSSIMIEVNRSSYMNEETGTKATQFICTKELISNIINNIITRCC